MQRFAIVLAFVCACGQGRGNAELEASYKTARESVTVGTAWSKATAAIEKRLGPAKTKSGTEWRWAAVDGDHCYDMRLMRSASGDTVNGVTGGYVNSLVEDRFGRCKAIAETSSPVP